MRASLRERELAVRTAMGGSRWDLIRQTMAEALVIACIGAAGGLALAYAGIRELRALAPATLPRLDAIRLDPVVIGFTALAALVAAALFGIVPALRASRPDIAIVLRGSSRTTGLGSAGLLRNFVVVAEVALSFVLLIASGLMVRSFLELQRIDPGFDSRHLLKFQTIGGRRGTQPEQRAAWVRDLAGKLRPCRGVQECRGRQPFSASSAILADPLGTRSCTDGSLAIRGGGQSDRAARLFRDHAHSARSRAVRSPRRITRRTATA